MKDKKNYSCCSHKRAGSSRGGTGAGVWEDVLCTVQLGQAGIKYEFGWGFGSTRLTAGRMRKNNRCIETNTTNVTQREYQNTVMVYCIKKWDVPLVFIPYKEVGLRISIDQILR